MSRSPTRSGIGPKCRIRCRYPKTFARDRLYLTGDRHIAPRGRFSQFPQQTREKSPVPMRSEIRRNPPDISKGILQNSFSRFESWHPSDPLSPFCPFRSLGERATIPRVSATSAGLFSKKSRGLRLPPVYLPASLRSRFFDIQFLLLETRFESTETGLSSRQVHAGNQLLDWRAATAMTCRHFLEI